MGIWLKFLQCFGKVEKICVVCFHDLNFKMWRYVCILLMLITQCCLYVNVQDVTYIVPESVVLTVYWLLTSIVLVSSSVRFLLSFSVCVCAR